MTRPTFRPDPRRDTAAATLVQSAYCWPVLTLKVAVGAFRPGERFFAVPSSEPGRNYLANARFCACPDYQRRGSGCKHQRAVLLHLAALEGAAEQQEQQAEALGMTADGEARLELAFAALSPDAGAVVRLS